MNKTIIELIKNILQKEQPNNMGLFSGSIGTCLALYVINKKLKDSELCVIIDTMIENTIEKTASVRNLTLDNGLLGIGIAINYLIANNYVEGDVDEVLSDIDAKLYSTLKNNKIKFGISCSTGLIGMLVYLVERLSSSKNCESITYKLNVASLREVINRLERIMPSLFSGLTKDVFLSIINNYPILFIYLAKAYDLNVYSKKILATFRVWSILLESYSPYYNTNKLYMAIALQYLNTKINNSHLDKYIDLLIKSIDKEKLIKEIDIKIFNINEGFLFVSILLYAAEHLFGNMDFGSVCHGLRQNILCKFMPLYRKYLDEVDENNICLNLINGFLGVEMINELYPEILSINKKQQLLYTK